MIELGYLLFTLRTVFISIQKYPSTKKLNLIEENISLLFEIRVQILKLVDIVNISTMIKVIIYIK